MNEFNERIRQIEAELIDWNVPYLRKSTIQRSKCAKHLVTKISGGALGRFSVHVLARELTMNSSTFRSIQEVLSTICKHDEERFKNLPPHKDTGQTEEHSTAQQRLDQLGASSHSGMGYFSPGSRHYLVRFLIHIRVRQSQLPLRRIFRQT